MNVNWGRIFDIVIRIMQIGLIIMGVFIMFFLMIGGSAIAQGKGDMTLVEYLRE